MSLTGLNTQCPLLTEERRGEEKSRHIVTENGTETEVEEEN